LQCGNARWQGIRPIAPSLFRTLLIWYNALGWIFKFASGGLQLLLHGLLHAYSVQTRGGSLATCRAHGIDAYTYLVDVLQRVNQHPARRIAELTPRLWADRFGHSPLRSDLARCG